MQLGDVFDNESFDVFTASVEVDRVEVDSRQCEFSTLFFALQGTTTDGAKFAAHAVDRGAVAIVATHSIKSPVPVVVMPESRIYAALTHASKILSGHPEVGIDVIGVTGTNGKTSVSVLVAQLARVLQWNGATIGTLTNERTTPAAPELYRTFARVRTDFDSQRPKSVIALEVSSHALVQHRVEGTHFSVVAFTNLSHDHLDYHHTMEDYFAAKTRLFQPEFSQRAVIWVDDPYGARLAETTSLAVAPVSRRDASDVASTLGGTVFFWRGHLVNTTLIGDYNVDNALMAMTIVSELGASDAAVAGAMSEVEAVPGRFEVVYHGEFTVIVDYAHTPQGLERLLQSVRSLSSGRVVTVFGCGGERDSAKRPVMGRVSSELSDVTIVTSDNPRGESPDAIIDAIVAGAIVSAHVVRQVDRRAAIAQAVRTAQTGDVVVVAGKGHETTQTFAESVVAFDDREVVRELVREKQC
ncbi:MAG: UDP-N-acetylmuramoyl-L-alanyl-D-glutamate--2,6-diaminopimelate ligase [Acidimicrobiaceae bacterium]|nr:UDP-N-acetylmuramoyl-L-alanyl-D-glutamate--2,6-diaminopimelate ligase [Acidimicrobiaceae bacterium]